MVKSLLIGNLIEYPSNHVSIESVKILAKVCNNFFSSHIVLTNFFSQQTSASASVLSKKRAKILNEIKFRLLKVPSTLRKNVQNSINVSLETFVKRKIQ